MKNNLTFLSPLLFILPLVAFADTSPRDVYEKYNSKVKAGISFEEEKSYFTQRKQDEVVSKIPRYMKQLNKSRSEVIEFYLDITMNTAKCKAITLTNESIDGDTANLEYSQKDICGNRSSSPQKQKIKMIKENGWKIDKIVISI